MSDRDDARATLLRALEQLDAAEGDLAGDYDDLHLCVVYSGGRVPEDDEGSWHEVGGWVKTKGPLWLHAAMCRRAAEALEETERGPDYDGEEDEEP